MKLKQLVRQLCILVQTTHIPDNVAEEENNQIHIISLRLSLANLVPGNLTERPEHLELNHQEQRGDSLLIILIYKSILYKMLNEKCLLDVENLNCYSILELNKTCTKCFLICGTDTRILKV